MNHAPFLCAILTQLGQPFPVLVYADWLEESGDGDGAAWWRGLAGGMGAVRVAFNWHPQEVEIFRAGNLRGLVFTEADLETIAENFYRNSAPDVDGLYVYVVSGHEDRAPLVGVVQWVWRRGDKLFALYNPHAYQWMRTNWNPPGTMSVELWHEPPEGCQGKGWMLRRVVVLPNLGAIPLIFRTLARSEHNRPPTAEERADILPWWDYEPVRPLTAEQIEAIGLDIPAGATINRVRFSTGVGGPLELEVAAHEEAGVFPRLEEVEYTTPPTD